MRTFVLFSQESSDTCTQKLSISYVNQISTKVEKVKAQLESSSNKALDNLKRIESSIYKKLYKADSIVAKRLVSTSHQQYAQIYQSLKTPGQLNQYLPHFDSIDVSLKFLMKNSELFSSFKGAKNKLNDALTSVENLKNQLQKVEDVKTFLKERKQFLKEQLSKYGFGKQLKKINKKVYYFSQQIQEYKAVLKDKKKIEKKALELLSRTKLFQDFMKKNSFLASIFPSNNTTSNGVGSQTGFAGLQTRAQVVSFVQGPVEPNTAGNLLGLELLKNIQNSQGYIDLIRNKLNSVGNTADLDMPDFKPNHEKTKSFKKRLELGTNFQTVKSSLFFPSTTDVGLSIGYKLNQNSLIGIGSSFKIGWGKNIQHIKITGEGLSIRSFADIRLKKSFYASGGFEYNYQQSFSEVRSLYQVGAWKKSALIGLTKIVSLKGKFLKGTKIQLLYDFLAKEKLPITQPLKFRVGYTF